MAAAKRTNERRRLQALQQSQADSTTDAAGGDGRNGLMKVLEWLVANIVILAIGACAGVSGLAVILLFRWFELPDDLWPYAGIPAAVATIGGAIYGGRGVLWLVDRVGNRRYYRQLQERERKSKG